MSIMGLTGEKWRRSRTAIAVFVILSVAGVHCHPANSYDRTRSASPSEQPAAKRQKTGNNNNHRVMEPAFENAGQVAGLEIWRIEDFKPVAYPKSQFGKFYSGDSYILLYTKINKHGDKTWDIHFWLGSETSQDESGTAAILSVQLDEQLGGGPVQHREVQDHESQQFLSYFKNGVRYLPGGVTSGFHHVDRDAYVNRLYEVKGSRNVRVKEVVPNISSMNKGDCFILDSGRNVYVYVGNKARRIEKLKAIGAANQLRDQDHAGKARVTIVDEYSPESDYTDFFNALGGGSKDDVPEDTVGGDDQQFETNEERVVTLYRVSDASGTVQVTPVGQRPLDPTVLDSSDCYILDTADANIFVWRGKKCTNSEKQQALAKADSYIASKNHPKWTHVVSIVQGAEPVAFTQYFRTWQGIGEQRTRLVRSASADWEARLYHAQISKTGTQFIVEQVHDFDQSDLNVDDIMFMDVGREIYIWIGEGASQEEKGKSGSFVENYLKNHGREDVTITTIYQAEEPPSFKSHFPSWDADLWNNVSDLREFIKNETDED